MNILKLLKQRNTYKLKYENVLEQENTYLKIIEDLRSQLDTARDTIKQMKIREKKYKKELREKKWELLLSLKLSIRELEEKRFLLREL